MQISVRRNLAWMSLSQGGLFFIQFGGSVAMARLLSPHEMGIYAVAAAVVGLLNMLRAFGLNSFVVREPELTDTAAATVFTINAAINLLCSLVIYGVSLLPSAALGDPGVANVMRLLALTPLLNIFEFVPSARLERGGAFRILAIVNVIKSLVNIGLTVLLATIGFSYMSIAWGNIATALLGAVCFNIVGWRFVRLRLGVTDWRRIGRFGMQMLTIGVVGGITSRVTDLLVGRLIGLAPLGLYSRASGLNGLLWDNVHLVIARVVFQDFAEHRRRGLSLRETYLRIVAMLTALLWPAFAGLAILAGPVIVTIYGENWIGAALPLSLLSVAGMLLVAITMTGEVFIVSGATRVQLHFEIKRNIIGLSLFAIACAGGLAWAAASRIVDAIVAIALAKDNLNKMTDTRAADFTPVYLQSAGLTVLACAPAATVMALNGWSEHTSWVAIAAAVTAGIALWALGLWRLRHPIYREALVVGGRLLPRSLRRV